MTVTTHGFVPAELDAAVWDEVEPLLSSLRDRAVTDRSGAEAWLVDRSELEASIEEAGTLLYINMSCDTSDKSASDAYRAYISDFVPKLKPLAFELDRVQADLCERFGHDGRRYEVLHRDTKAASRLFREENVPLETRLETLEPGLPEAITGAMTVEFDGRERTHAADGPGTSSRTDRSVREAAWRASRAAAEDARSDRRDLRRDGQAPPRGREERGLRRPSRATRSPRSTGSTTRPRCASRSTTASRRRSCRCARARRGARRALGVDELRPWDLSVDPTGRRAAAPVRRRRRPGRARPAGLRALDPALASMFGTLGDGANTSGVATGAFLDLDSRRARPRAATSTCSSRPASPSSS
jgi:oligoendopeptidase F